MIKKIIVLLFLLLPMASLCRGKNNNISLSACCQKQKSEPNLSIPSQEEPDVNSVDTILKRLNEEIKKLNSYQVQIESLFSQPTFDSQTFRKGTLYYQKSKNKSELRINFHTVKYDDEKEKKYADQYIFDGVWLTHLDYPNKQAKCYQKAEPNNPIDCFELVRQNFPIIGFGKTEDLRKDFQISFAEEQSEEFIKLHLEVKPDSIYRDDYTFIDFWVDRKLYLPAKIIAHSIEEEIYEIRLIKPRVNKRINKNVFEFRIPEEFGSPEIVPLGNDKS